MQSGSPGSYTYSVSYNASDWSSYVTYNSSLYPIRSGCGERRTGIRCNLGRCGAVRQLAAKRPTDELGRGGRLDGDGSLHAQRGDIGVCPHGD